LHNPISNSTTSSPKKFDQDAATAGESAVVDGRGPWWTAVGRVDDESVCLVSVLRLHFMEHYTGRPSDFVL
jgi:hypothetical protein